MKVGYWRGAGLAVAAMLMAPVGLGAQALITVSLSMGGRAFGPDTVAAVAMPGSASDRGGTGQKGSIGALSGANRGGDEVLLTLHPGRASEDLSRLAAMAAKGHAAVGTCDLILRSGSGVAFQTAHMTGCFVRRVDGAGGMRQVSLGYRTISVQTPNSGGADQVQGK